jgi:hypothetical protein
LVLFELSEIVVFDFSEEIVSWLKALFSIGTKKNTNMKTLIKDIGFICF